MSAPKKTSTPTLVSALRILAAEIESPDGVANMTIAEAADRIEELAEWQAREASAGDEGDTEIRRLVSQVADLRRELEHVSLCSRTRDGENVKLSARVAELVEAVDLLDWYERHPDRIDVTGEADGVAARWYFFDGETWSGPAADLRDAIRQARASEVRRG